jgi:hypothetical protein
LTAYKNNTKLHKKKQIHGAAVKNNNPQNCLRKKNKYTELPSKTINPQNCLQKTINPANQSAKYYIRKTALKNNKAATLFTTKIRTHGPKTTKYF